MNVDELHDEMEGSKRDIQEACDSVHIMYYHTTQPWMQRQYVQAALVIHIKHPARPSSATPTTPASPLVLYAAATMPHGYQRIHPPAGHIRASGVVDESTVFTYGSDATYYPTLNGLLMTHSEQYRVNKEGELARKLQLLAAAHGDEDAEADANGVEDGKEPHAPYQLSG